MKRPWAFICASEGATSKHLRNYCREVYLLGYLLSLIHILADSMIQVQFTIFFENAYLMPGFHTEVEEKGLVSMICLLYTSDHRR